MNNRPTWTSRHTYLDPHWDPTRAASINNGGGQETTSSQQPQGTTPAPLTGYYHSAYSNPGVGGPTYSFILLHYWNMTRVKRINKYAATVEDGDSGDDGHSQQTRPVSTRPDESSFTPASNASDSTYGGNTPPASAGTGHESDNSGHDDTGSQRSGGVYQRSYNWPPAASGGNGGDEGQLSRPPSPAGDSRTHSVTTSFGSWNTGCQAQEVKKPTVFNFGDLRVNSGNYRKPQSPQGSGPGVNYPEERRTPTIGAMAVFGPGNTGIQMQINGVDRGAVCGGRKNGSGPAGLESRVGKKQRLLAMGRKLGGNAEKMRKQWG